MLEDVEIEPVTLEGVCYRAILHTILTTLKTKYKNISIDWPVENTDKGNESVDFAQAHITSHRSNYKPIIVDFCSGNIRITTIKPNHIRFFLIKEISVANPEFHIETIAFISNLLDEEFA